MASARPGADQRRADDLLVLAAAIQAGAGPRGAVLCLGDTGLLAEERRALAAGATLAELTRRADASGSGAGAVLRALAMAEVCGASSTAALEGVLDAARAQERVQLLVHARTSQARTTARILIALPVVAVLLSLLMGGGARSFLRSPAGVVCLAVAALLVAGAWLWTRQLIASVPRRALGADPLLARPALDRAGPLAVVGLMLVLGAVIVGPLAGLLLAAAMSGPALRLARTTDQDGDGHLEHARRSQAMSSPTAEALDLLAMALSAGLPIAAAVDQAAGLVAPPARAWLATARAGLRAGTDPGVAFGTRVSGIGPLLRTTADLGAPAAPALRLLAHDLRERVSARAEETAERLAVLLVFPTTLLLVPAFVLVLVVPQLAAALGELELGL